MAWVRGEGDVNLRWRDPRGARVVHGTVVCCNGGGWWFALVVEDGGKLLVVRTVARGETGVRRWWSWARTQDVGFWGVMVQEFGGRVVVMGMLVVKESEDEKRECECGEDGDGM
ncbi:unnamed protein product [Sphenostylis stenocarpa]|uniref:Uncharacterized protein n=1 Tax=Sphenostylis stenocarpa TaxID=92480 RepID=A0AA86SD37_9FABA|nr:unnamed protein product [Sphenostylis stenocarpa]